MQLLPIERLDTVFLETRHLDADHRAANLTLHYRLSIDGHPRDEYRIAVDGACDTSTFSAEARAGAIAGRLPLEVTDPRLWWSRGRGPADVYDVTVRLLKNGQEIDRLELRHGVRTIELDRSSTTDSDGSGEFCFRVNGERVFVLGTNWVPLDAYHSRDLARLDRAIEMVEELGCNMIRCWGGNVYEHDRFYDLCDRKGILVWQDFAMACHQPAQDPTFLTAIAAEARAVVRRLRAHPCVALWAGDNEVDVLLDRGRDPNDNAITRRVLPEVLREEDWTRPYLPSSPYIDEVAFRQGVDSLPENHLWGPRDYYKSAFYTTSACHFASEIGYHGCPSPASIRKFISPGKVWPYAGNEEWLLHSTDPIPGVSINAGRVDLMANQVRVLFGDVPDDLDAFAFASQVSQAEAKKFFIEMFRVAKWRRTGILWWNLLDCWPQFSDAIVDYYFTKKLAFDYVRRAQQPLLLALREPAGDQQQLVACNDTRDDRSFGYRVTDIDTGDVVASGNGVASADAATPVAALPVAPGTQRFLVIEWDSGTGRGSSHYLSGTPPFSLSDYRRWLAAFEQRARESVG